MCMLIAVCGGVAGVCHVYADYCTVCVGGGRCLVMCMLVTVEGWQVYVECMLITVQCVDGWQMSVMCMLITMEGGWCLLCIH